MGLASPEVANTAAGRLREGVLLAINSSCSYYGVKEQLGYPPVHVLSLVREGEVCLWPGTL